MYNYLLSPSTHTHTYTHINTAYADHTKKNEDQLTIKRGDIVGRVKDNSDMWKVSCFIITLL